MEKIPYLGRTLMRWRAGSSTFLAMPELGARLMNWSVALGDGSVRDVLHWPEIGTLEKFQSVRGGNPVLFPFAGRSFDKGDALFWRDAAGVRRPMPAHGLARQGSFEAASSDDRGFVARFLPDAEARAAYPYDYEFTVAYRFDPLGLACEFRLENRGREPMPWSAGHHFYFTLPWTAGTARADYRIRIPAARRLRLDPSGGLVPGPALQPEESLAQPALIDTIHTAMLSNEVVFGEKGRPGDIAIRLGTERIPDPDAAFITWTAADDSPFYCVEPWMGPPNAAGNKAGLHWVPPGASEAFTVDIRLR